MRVIILFCLFSILFFACESTKPKPEQEQAEINTTVEPKDPPKKSKAPNKGLDTLVNGSRYRFEIVEGEKDQLKVEKIKDGQTKSLMIEATQDRLYLSAILFDQKPQPRFGALQVFSDELFAFGTFDQQLQKIWLIRDQPEGLKIEELDANKTPLVSRGRYLIYVPKEEMLALPQIPEQIDGKEQTIVHRYRINNEGYILRLSPDTVSQPQ